VAVEVAVGMTSMAVSDGLLLYFAYLDINICTCTHLIELHSSIVQQNHLPHDALTAHSFFSFKSHISPLFVIRVRI